MTKIRAGARVRCVSSFVCAAQPVALADVKGQVGSGLLSVIQIMSEVDQSELFGSSSIAMIVNRSGGCARQSPTPME
jgi:hypothetical protein